MFMALAALPARAEPGQGPGPSKDPGQGIAISLNQPEGNGPASSAITLELRIADQATGAGLGQQMPRLWLVPGAISAAECAERAAPLKRGNVRGQGLIDLAGFEVIEATRTGPIAFVDPDMSLATADIRNIHPLREMPASWALDATGERLALVEASSGRLSVIGVDPPTEIAAPSMSAPATAVLAFDDGFVAGGADGRLVRLDANGLVMETLAVGNQPVRLANARGGAVAAISGSNAMLLGPGARRLGFRLPYAGEGAAYAAKPDLLAITEANGQHLALVNPDDPGTVRTLRLPERLMRIAADGEGRWLVALDRTLRQLWLVDPASPRVVGVLGMSGAIADFAFSDVFLYVLLGTGELVRYEIANLGSLPAPARIMAGPVYAEAEPASPLGRMLPLPGSGMMVASARDRSAFLLTDDEAKATHNRFAFKAGEPAGLLARSRAPREIAPGRYVTTFVRPPGNAYTAVVVWGDTSASACLPLTMPGGSAPLPAAARAFLHGPDRIAANQPYIDIEIEAPDGPVIAGQAIIYRIADGSREFVKWTHLQGGKLRIANPPVEPGRYGLSIEVTLPDGRDSNLDLRFTVDHGTTGTP